MVNIESIIRIDKEMEEMKNSGFGSQSSRGNHTEEVKGASEKGIVTKKCRYYDKGYCKYASKCRYSHPKEMCRTYKESKRCKDRGCGGRHPRACKWFQRDVGCRRLNCDYLHVKTNVAKNENLQKECKQFKCAGCNDTWEDTNCVVKHQLKHGEVYFCLNCDDWIVNKSEVFNIGWTLFDQYGNLRQNV